MAMLLWGAPSPHSLGLTACCLTCRGTITHGCHINTIHWGGNAKMLFSVPRTGDGGKPTKFECQNHLPITQWNIGTSLLFVGVRAMMSMWMKLSVLNRLSNDDEMQFVFGRRMREYVRINCVNYSLPIHTYIPCQNLHVKKARWLISIWKRHRDHPREHPTASCTGSSIYMVTKV